MKEKILIIGRPGTGKTNLGNVLAELMNYDLVDEVPSAQWLFVNAEPRKVYVSNSITKAEATLYLRNFTMKKLISILAVVLLSVSAMAQVSTASGSLKTLKSFRLGVCKIVEVTKGEAVTYQITGQLAGTSSLEMDIDLGDADAAVKTLLSLAEYKPSSSNEIVHLNNPAGHTARFSKMAGVWQIFSPGNQFTVNISRGELKKMAEVITNNK